MSCGDFSAVHWGLSTHPPSLLSWSFCPWTSIDFHAGLSPHMLCAEESRFSGTKTRLAISILASKKTASVPLQRRLCTCLWSSLGTPVRLLQPSPRAHELACEKPSQHTQQQLCRHYSTLHRPQAPTPAIRLSLLSHDIIVSQHLLSISPLPDAVPSTVCSECTGQSYFFLPDPSMASL